MNLIRKMFGLEPLLHWYSFSYASLSDNGWMQIACTYTGYPEKRVSKPRIDQNKLNAEVPTNSVLTSVCYLGKMTRSQMLSEE